MPTKKEREYYRMGFADGLRTGQGIGDDIDYSTRESVRSTMKRTVKRKLSAWNKFVKANSRKKEFRYRDGKLNLKKMGVAFRRKKRR